MNRKKMVQILDIVLFFGLLTHSIILLYINKNYNPLNIAGIDVQERITWRKTAEFVFSICCVVYMIGNISFVAISMKKQRYISFRLIFVYFIRQVGLMALCTVPFAVFDVSYFGDYVFPALESVGTLAVILFVAFIIELLLKKREI